MSLSHDLSPKYIESSKKDEEIIHYLSSKGTRRCSYPVTDDEKELKRAKDRICARDKYLKIKLTKMGIQFVEILEIIKNLKSKVANLINPQLTDEQPPSVEEINEQSPPLVQKTNKQPSIISSVQLTILEGKYTISQFLENSEPPSALNNNTDFSQLLLTPNKNAEKLKCNILPDKKAEIHDKKAEIHDKKAEIPNKKAELSGKKAELSGKKAEIPNKKAEIHDKKAEIHDKKAELSGKKAEIPNKKAETTAKNKLKSLIKELRLSRKGNRK